MRKAVNSVLLFVLGCSIIASVLIIGKIISESTFNNYKNEMIQIYSNDKNYITLTGEVVSINDEGYYIKCIIKCDELKKYFLNENNECEYWVFSDSSVNINIGDSIIYTTAKVLYKGSRWLPIVAINKNNENILEFHEGKENLIDWVKQLQKK